jgi:YgiT-type zinc finger domain-containing protein
VKCVICKEGDLQSRIVSVNFERDGAWLVVQNVPALVCDGCGERYFDDEITRQLLAMVKNTLKPGVSLDIRQYQEAA